MVEEGVYIIDECLECYSYIFPIDLSFLAWLGLIVPVIFIIVLIDNKFFRRIK